MGTGTSSGLSSRAMGRPLVTMTLRSGTTGNEPIGKNEYSVIDMNKFLRTFFYT
jgi:hypothetical protein